MLAQHHRMMQAADRRDVRPMLFQRLQRLRELVVRACLFDLPRQCVDAVGDIKKHAAFRLRDRLGSTRTGGQHGVEEWQGDRGSESAQNLATAKLPAFHIQVAHGLFLVRC